jgi:catechol 2,3-dioxygenase-like lactoylglutathione lyase family enzyme
MLKDAQVMATVAVRDLAQARRFYEGQLGLSPDGPGEEAMAAYRCGGALLLVYESQFAGTNRATAATWAIASGLEELVRSLQAKGVTFEQYDLPDTVREGVIHRGGGRSVAWCKDPDGNILCFAQE